MMDKNLLCEDNKKEKCKGLFFRFHENLYLSSHMGFECKLSLRLLKSISCKGCPTCDKSWLEEELKLWLENTDPVKLFSNLCTTKTYKLKIECSSCTPPYYDDGECEFSFVEQE